MILTHSFRKVGHISPHIHIATFPPKIPIPVREVNGRPKNQEAKVSLLQRQQRAISKICLWGSSLVICGSDKNSGIERELVQRYLMVIARIIWRDKHIIGRRVSPFLEKPKNVTRKTKAEIREMLTVNNSMS